MKLLNILTIIFLITGTNISRGQTYLDGQWVIPFSEAGNSTYLPATKRLDYTEARSKMLTVIPDHFKMISNSLVGEYWWIDGMLVQIVTRQIKEPVNKLNMEDEMYASRNLSGNNKDYYDTLKKVNNFNVIIYYYKGRKYKRFKIQDNDERYIVSGTIYCTSTDFEKSHVFIEKLVESIKLTE